MSEKRPGGSPGAPFLGSDLSEETFGRLRSILLEKRGLDLDMYKDGCVRRRIARRVRARGLGDAASYLKALRREEGEIDALMAALSVHVSQFFRNPHTFAVLKETVLPELLRCARQAPRRTLRIWSIGCSDGEEPYTLALLLAEAGAGDITISILGTDLSPEALERARQGLYAAPQLAEVPAPLLERYFAPEGKRFRLDERIRSMVRFRRHDVLSGPEFPEADLVLCRNVLIYFSHREQERVLDRLASVIPGGGFLVLGKAEILPAGVRGLFRIENAGERIYRRN